MTIWGWGGTAAKPNPIGTAVGQGYAPGTGPAVTWSGAPVQTAAPAPQQPPQQSAPAPSTTSSGPSEYDKLLAQQQATNTANQMAKLEFERATAEGLAEDRALDRAKQAWLQTYQQAQLDYQNQQAATASAQWQQQFGLTKEQADLAAQQWAQQFGFTQQQADLGAQQWQQQFAGQQAENDRQYQLSKEKLAQDYAAHGDTLRFQEESRALDEAYRQQQAVQQQQSIEAQDRQFREGLAAQQAENDRQYQADQARLAQEYAIHGDLLKFQTDSRALDEAYRQQQAATQAGQYQQTFTEGQRQFDTQLAQQKAELDQAYQINKERLAHELTIHGDQLKFQTDTRALDEQYRRDTLALDQQRQAAQEQQFGQTLAEQQRQFNETRDQRANELEQQYRLEQQKLEQAYQIHGDRLKFDEDSRRLDEAYRQQQLALQQQQFGEQQRQFNVGASGYMDVNGVQTPTLAREQFQQQAGMDVLNLASTLRGPADMFQYLRTFGGAPQGLTDVVNAAAGQYQLPSSAGAAAGAQYSPATVGSLVGSLQPGALQQQQAEMNNAIARLPAANQINAASFNNMSPTQRDALLGLYEAGGQRPEDVLDAYLKSLPKFGASPAGAGRVAFAQ